MVKSKIAIGVSIIVLLGLCTAGYYYYTSTQTFKFIDSELEKKEWSNEIKTQNNEFDYKRGIFYKKVVFKDEPSHVYDIEVIKDESKKSLFSITYDSENVEITNKSIAKYTLP